MPYDPAGDDLGASCRPLSQAVVEVALSYLGSGETVSLVAPAVTQVNIEGMRHYPRAVEAALKAHPWGFARRYARLDVEAGEEAAPVNADWIYSFEIPADCLFVRRIVQEPYRRTYDPAPPPFDMGTNNQTSAANEVASGKRVVFTNFRDPDTTDEDPEIDIEYTARPYCAAAVGDELFKEAVAWLMASKLAPTFSRNKITAADAYAMYLRTLQVAMTKDMQQLQRESGILDEGEARWHEGRGAVGSSRRWSWP